MTRRLVPAVVLGVIVLRFGPSAIVDGLRSVTAWSLAVAVSLTALTTLAAAWRWQWRWYC